jgi:hypothetical protein
MWQDYLTEFSGILPRVVARLNAETPYWPSSSSADYEAVTPAFHTGDDHIWDVWHGRVPFSTYETHHSRFVTEYGFQSFPEMKTIDAFTEPEDRTGIFTPVMLAHQKNNEGNSIIHDYLLRDYPEPKDFPSFLYVSQVLQAEGIKTGDHGLHLLAVERLLAGGFVVVDRLLRPLEGLAILRAPILCAGAGFTAFGRRFGEDVHCFGQDRGAAGYAAGPLDGFRRQGAA